MNDSDLSPGTVAMSLAHAQDMGMARLDAQLLLLHALGRSGRERAWLLTHDRQALTSEQRALYGTHVQRRLNGEPLAYITGHKEFFGLDLAVDPRVLVPRPDTETLVQWALDVLARPAVGIEPPQVLDLGTGSGAIALALKAARPDLQVVALDASKAALAVARANARRLQLNLRFQRGCWLASVVGRFDVIVSNPPYVAAHDPHLRALRHEPLLALAAGSDGLDDIRHIIEQAGAHLKPAGCLLLEHGYEQAQAVRELLRLAGFDSVQSRRDLNGIERCSAGHWSARQPPQTSADTCAT